MLNRYSVAQKSGAVGCVLGAAWVFFLGVLPIVRALLKAGDWLDGVLTIIMPFFLSGVGIIFIVLGLQLMRYEPTRVRIKNLFGMLCGVGTFFCAVLFIWPLEVLGYESREGLEFFFALFAALLIMLPLYAKLSKFVMSRSGIAAVKGAFVGRGCYQIFAFLLWSILEALMPSDIDRWEANGWLYFAMVFGPIIVTYLVYRLAVKYWVRETIYEEVALDHPSKAEAAS